MKWYTGKDQIDVGNLIGQKFLRSAVHPYPVYTLNTPPTPRPAYFKHLKAHFFQETGLPCYLKFMYHEINADCRAI